MIILIWILFALLPFVWGLGIQSATLLLHGGRGKIRYFFTDAWLSGSMICVLVGQTTHLWGIGGERSLLECQRLFWGLMCGLSVLFLILVFIGWNYRKLFSEVKVIGEDKNKAWALMFLIFLFVEVAFIFCVEPIIVPGDMMTETVNSFIAENGIYRVNPLTGQPYVIGLSGRITFLSLPTDYAILCMTFGQQVGFFLHHVIPEVVLLASVMAYYRLSRRLFGERGKWNYLFLVFVLAIFLLGENADFLSGYNALHSGYLGSSIRNLVLLPTTISIMLDLLAEPPKEGKTDSVHRKFWMLMLICCFLTECSISITFFGLGYCVIVALVMYVSKRVDDRIRNRGQKKNPWNIKIGRAPWEVDK